MSPSHEQNSTSAFSRSAIEKSFWEEIEKGKQVALESLADIFEGPEHVQLEKFRAMIHLKCRHISHRHAATILRDAAIIRAVDGLAWRDAVEKSSEFHNEKIRAELDEAFNRLKPLLGALQLLDDVYKGEPN